MWPEAFIHFAASFFSYLSSSFVGLYLLAHSLENHLSCINLNENYLINAMAEINFYYVNLISSYLVALQRAWSELKITHTKIRLILMKISLLIFGLYFSILYPSVKSSSTRQLFVTTQYAPESIFAKLS